MKEAERFKHQNACFIEKENSLPSKQAPQKQTKQRQANHALSLDKRERDSQRLTLDSAPNQSSHPAASATAAESEDLPTSLRALRVVVSVVVGVWGFSKLALRALFSVVPTKKQNYNDC